MVNKFDHEVMGTTVICIAIAILLCNLLGNTLVIVVLKNCKKFQSPNTHLLVNLAISDLTFVVFGFGDIIVSEQGPVAFMSYILHALVSIYILTALAVERYFAISKPFVHKVRAGKSLLNKVMIGVWLIALTLTAPGYFIYAADEKYLTDVNVTATHVAPIWLEPVKIANTSVLLICGMMVPTVVIFVCYSRVIYHVWFNTEAGQATNIALLRSRRKLTKLFIAVTVIFIITWTPSFGRLVVQLSGSRGVLQIYAPISTILAMLGSTANPVLYSLRCPRFRQEVVKRFAKKCACCKHRRLHLRPYSGNYTVGKSVRSRRHSVVVPVSMSVRGGYLNSFEKYSKTTITT